MTIYDLVPIIQVKRYGIYIRWASKQFCIEQITSRSAKQVSPIAVDGETTPAQVTTEGNPFFHRLTGDHKSMTQDEVLFVWKLN